MTSEIADHWEKMFKNCCIRVLCKRFNECHASSNVMIAKENAIIGSTDEFRKHNEKQLTIDKEYYWQQYIKAAGSKSRNMIENEVSKKYEEILNICGQKEEEDILK